MQQDDISPSDLWSKIISGERPHIEYDFPREDADGNPIGQFWMIALSINEMVAATIEAEKAAKKLATSKDDRTYEEIISWCKAIEILFRACRKQGDVSSPLFAVKQQIGKHLSADEIGILFHYYQKTAMAIGPIISHLTAEDAEDWIEKLASGAATPDFLLERLSWEALKSLIVFLAKRPLTSPISTTSPMPPQDESESAINLPAEL
jgi:hypothetical protein